MGKLDHRKAWLLETVRKKSKVMAQARSEGNIVHFGSLMALCHIKHSELAESLQKYKGRVVFRGDNVRDESGYLAVFSEQGTSASHMAAASGRHFSFRRHGR